MASGGADVVTETPQATSAMPPLSGRNLVTSAWWMTGSHLVAQGVAYGSLIVLARWLPPAAFGTVAVGAAVVYIAVFFVDRGTVGGIIVRPGLRPADLRAAFVRCVLIGAVLAAAMAMAAGGLVGMFASGGNVAAIAVLALCLPLHAIAVIPMALLQKTMHFRDLASVTAAANIASALVGRQLVLFAVVAILSVGVCLRDVHLDRMAPSPDDEVGSPRAERWFFLFGVTFVLTLNLDYLVVGHFGSAGLVGVYALAFTIAMAPSTHLSEQVGKVLFAATASDPRASSVRTEQSVVLMSMLLLPMLPVGILVAPSVLPNLLGDQWQAMVVPFQLLLVVGVGHAIVNCIGEALSGNGHIAFRAYAMVCRCTATLLALIVLVSIDGIRGAALAQVIVFVPYALLYFITGSRLAGTSIVRLAQRLRPVAFAVGAQLVFTTALLAGLLEVGISETLAQCAAAVLGLTASVPLLVRLGSRMRSA
jgi:O-antigen/teichoic acid export membrane protein